MQRYHPQARQLSRGVYLQRVGGVLAEFGVIPGGLLANST